MREVSILVAFFMAVSAWAGFTAPASAQYSTTLTCNFTQVVPGETVTIAGDGFDPDVPVTITVRQRNGTVLLTFPVTPDANGNIEFTFTIPTDAPLGQYDVIAEGIDGRETDPATSRQLSCPMTLVAQIDEDLAVTGSDTKPIVQIGLAAIALGALLVFATRRSNDDEPANTAV